jgi:hypothetical protein
MDPAPRAYSELPRDPELGVPVPFACGTPAYGAPPDGEPPSVRRLDGRRVTQCALSRVCGVCGASLGRPLAFIGTRAEVDRNAYHFPPSHLPCAEAMLAELLDVDGALLGQSGGGDQWVLSTAAAFEYVRPGREDADRRPTFQPHELLTGAG